MLQCPAATLTPAPPSWGAGTPRCWGRSRAHVQDISHPKSNQEVKYIYLPFAFHPQSLPARKHTFPGLWDVSDVVTPACTSWLTRSSSSSHNTRHFLCARIQEVSCREHCDLQCNALSRALVTGSIFHCWEQANAAVVQQLTDRYEWDPHCLIPMGMSFWPSIITGPPSRGEAPAFWR